ncbi:hypothetical protein [Microvirga lotononidis]|uniref:Uncharacterized protein n=1 Tax=Microvirga lotononidis TaxID=864069 RepID=I4YYQ1_9HYPH|nr:hypothetical protein [Microvirga lotononidis]EIM29093.1 hypothetical protein MicloDRAFT_00015640 [Microvirga lotononidis]WQO28934.1 hypothetical protein U0023_07640 [Microvirga lotononidis]
MAILGPLILIFLGTVVVLLYRRWQLRSAARLGVLILWLVLALVCSFAFYDRYWLWRDCFNELGRCYDSNAGVMVEQSGLIWGILTLPFGLLAIRGLRQLLRQRTAPPSPDSADFGGFFFPFPRARMRVGVKFQRFVTKYLI